MADITSAYQGLVNDPNFKYDTEAQQLASQLQTKAATVYGNLVGDPNFKYDTEAQQLAHQLRASGIVKDQTQGGLVNPNVAPAPNATTSASPFSSAALTKVGSNGGPNGCASFVCQVAKSQGLPVPNTANAADFEDRHLPGDARA